MRTLQYAVLTVMTTMIASACEDRTEEPAVLEGVRPENSSLIDIMRDLDVDMAAIAHGIWTEDYQAIRTASLGVANHPMVTEEERGLIQQTLGLDFAAFVEGDQHVHRTALELADVPPGSLAVVLGTYQRLQEGCVSCHSAFRARVAAARAP